MITITKELSEQKLVQYTADDGQLVYMDTLIFTPEEYKELDDNQNSNEWETLDSDNTSGTGVDFLLTGSVPDLTNYKNAGNVVSCRTYQRSI